MESYHMFDNNFCDMGGGAGREGCCGEVMVAWVVVGRNSEVAEGLKARGASVPRLSGVPSPTSTKPRDA